MAKKKPSAIEAFLALSDEEKEKVYKRFDREVIPESETVPTTEEDRKKWERFAKKARANRRARGRPTIGAGAERVNVSIERTLLKRADGFAQAKGMTRAQLIARGLELAMAKAS